jgi:hypothetical protein
MRVALFVAGSELAGLGEHTQRDGGGGATHV